MESWRSHLTRHLTRTNNIKLPLRGQCLPVSSALNLMATLEISLYQGDDGDGLARYKVAASNSSFSGAALVWGYAENFEELANVLKGFPQTTLSKVLKNFGSPSVGLCELEFCCIDGSGHAVVWVKLESEYPVHPSSRHESISMCIRIEPSAVDVFVQELRLFAAGTLEKATLYGV